jgi:hypothetical protein
MMPVSNIHYAIAERSRGISVGGIRVIRAPARHIGLIEAIDRRLKLLKGTTCTASRKAERTKYAVDDKGPATLPTSESSLV